MLSNAPYPYGYSASQKMTHIQQIDVCEQFLNNGSEEAYYQLFANEAVPKYPLYGGKDDNPLAVKFIEKTMELPYAELLSNLHNNELVISEIPLFNSIYNVDIVVSSLINGPLTFVEIGSHLCVPGSRREAMLKAGEGHSKLAAQLGLVEIDLSYIPRLSYITPLGREYLKKTRVEREQLVRKLMLRIPIISALFVQAKTDVASVQALIGTVTEKQTTIRRRGSSVWALIEYIGKEQDDSISYLISRIVV